MDVKPLNRTYNKKQNPLIHLSGIPTIRPLEFQMSKPFGITHQYSSESHL